MHFNLLLTTLFALARSQCDFTDVPENLQGEPSFPLEQELEIFPDNQTAEIALDGEFVVIDACTVELRDFTFFPQLVTVYLYANGMPISSDAVLGSNNITQSFTLDRGIPLEDMREVKIFAEEQQLNIANIQLTGDDGEGGQGDEAGTTATNAGSSAWDAMFQSLGVSITLLLALLST
eukprot:TRINITY_DN32205_c0_g1_i1.p1 TRINITY_DN32205_c0_g1~~TRINITY_DN32205_c0_g1_i1.p1  ORF type:complete len:178 (-),score=26.99 TRINITY_DN32205_c0_g1_i1:25-558(-)